MIVSLKWLKDYTDISMSVEELVERLTMVGLEIEGVSNRGQSLQQVIAVRVEAVRKHPNAERLRLCEVSDGKERHQIVCGAPNLVEGGVFPLALPGAQLPGGLTVEKTRIRGELSLGMLCSQRELQLGDDADGIWELPAATPLGMPLAEALGIRDVILDISITPNRSDCLSMIGIAREIAGISGGKVRYPEVVLKENGPSAHALTSVTVNDPIGCPRYAARVIEGVSIGPSPGWLKDRLEAVGLRSINNIVDVTNFMLMELGQPLHAFDFDRLAENRIVVRRAQAGERFTTLDRVERALFDDTLLICDGIQPVAIAGIMGGLDSEISPQTTRVLIESAYFQPECIRRSSKKLGLRSESSYRFERGVDPDGVPSALDRAAQLMMEVGGGVLASGRVDVYPEPIGQVELTLRVDRANRFLGTALSSDEMADILRAIEMEVNRLDENRLAVVPPSFRRDVTREVDLTEEIARLAGYNTIPTTYPEADLYVQPPDPHQTAREQMRQVLMGYGFYEAINYSFIARQSIQNLNLPAEDRRTQPIALQNPLSEDQAVLRTSLVPGLLQTAHYNLDHRNEDLKFYELSRVFLPDESKELPEERYHLVGLLAGLRYPNLLYGGDQKVDYADLKGVVEAILDQLCLSPCQFRVQDLPPYFDPGRAASVFYRDIRLGSIGRVHPDVEKNFDIKFPIWMFEMDFDLLFEYRQGRPFYKPLPKFPAVSRDIALLLAESLPVQEVKDFILSQPQPLLERVEIFDLYKSGQLGEKKKSVGYRLTYRATDRNLTDEEVNEIHQHLVAKLLKVYQAELR